MWQQINVVWPRSTQSGAHTPTHGAAGRALLHFTPDKRFISDTCSLSGNVKTADTRSRSVFCVLALSQNRDDDDDRQINTTAQVRLPTFSLC